MNIHQIVLVHLSVTIQQYLGALSLNTHSPAWSRQEHGEGTLENITVQNERPYYETIVLNDNYIEDTGAAEQVKGNGTVVVEEAECRLRKTIDDDGETRNAAVTGKTLNH